MTRALILICNKYNHVQKRDDNVSALQQRLLFPRRRTRRTLKRRKENTFSIQSGLKTSWEIVESCSGKNEEVTVAENYTVSIGTAYLQYY